MGAEPSENALNDVRRYSHYLHLRAHYAARAQFLASKRSSRAHLTLGAPVVVLTAIVGTTIFGSLNASPSVGWKVVAGLVSVTSAVLAALQTFFNYAGQAKEHYAAGIRYSRAQQELDLFILSLNSDSDVIQARESLSMFLEKWATMESEVPDVSDRLYEKAKDEKSASIDVIQFDTESKPDS